MKLVIFPVQQLGWILKQPLVGPSPVGVTADANDPGDNLFYEIVSGPSTMTINSSTGAITWIADCSDPVTVRCDIICSKEVTVKVTDDGCCPLSAQDTFVINVWDALP